MNTATECKIDRGSINDYNGFLSSENWVFRNMKVGSVLVFNDGRAEITEVTDAGIKYRII
jgi:hypothetical protein